MYRDVHANFVALYIHNTCMCIVGIEQTCKFVGVSQLCQCMVFSIDYFRQACELKGRCMNI